MSRAARRVSGRLRDTLGCARRSAVPHDDGCARSRDDRPPGSERSPHDEYLEYQCGDDDFADERGAVTSRQLKPERRDRHEHDRRRGRPGHHHEGTDRADHDLSHGFSPRCPKRHRFIAGTMTAPVDPPQVYPGDRPSSTQRDRSDDARRARGARGSHAVQAQRSSTRPCAASEQERDHGARFHGPEKPGAALGSRGVMGRRDPPAT